MATLRRRISVARPPAEVWDLVRDVGALHTRLVPGCVLDTRLEGNVRTVTFFNGMVVREPIVSVEDVEMRVAWAAEAPGLDHDKGSVQVLPLGAARCEVLWIADVLPDEGARDIDAMMERGLAAMGEALATPER